MNVRWFPPAWLLIESQSKVMYIDPAWIQNNFRSYPKKVIYSHYPEPMDGLPEPDLPKADVVLITHHHQDHIKTATLKRLTTDKTVVIAPEKCRELIARDFDVIMPDETRQVAGFSIKAVPAYNTSDGSSTRKVHHKGECVGYVITVGDKAIYHAGDTDVIPEMSKLGAIDVAFLPIGGTFTMNIADAVNAAKKINAKLTIPMHFLKANPSEFERLAVSSSNVKVKVLPIGGSWQSEDG